MGTILQQQVQQVYGISRPGDPVPPIFTSQAKSNSSKTPQNPTCIDAHLNRTYLVDSGALLPWVKPQWNPLVLHPSDFSSVPGHLFHRQVSIPWSQDISKPSRPPHRAPHGLAPGPPAFSLAVISGGLEILEVQNLESNLHTKDLANLVLDQACCRSRSRQVQGCNFLSQLKWKLVQRLVIHLNPPFLLRKPICQRVDSPHLDLSIYRSIYLSIYVSSYIAS